MVYEGEQQGAEVVAKKLIGTAVKKLFDAKFPAPDAGRPSERRRQELDEDEEPTGPVRRARPAPATEKVHPLYEPIVGWFSARSEPDTLCVSHTTSNWKSASPVTTQKRYTTGSATAGSVVHNATATSASAWQARLKTASAKIRPRPSSSAAIARR